MSVRKIVAVFDTSAAAEAARARLIEKGISREQIKLTDQASLGERRFETPHARGSFWAHLKEMFMPEHDRHTYEESVRRGGCMLVASVDEVRADEAIACLESAGAVDLDERQNQWRSQGWQPGVATGDAGGSGVSTTQTRSGGAIGSAGAVRSDRAARQAGAIGSTGEAGSARTARSDGTARRAGAIGSTDEAGSASTVGPAGAAGQASAVGSAGGAAGQESERIPVIEERLRVGKREVSRGSVRVRSYVVEEPVHEEVRLREERVSVERRPVNEPARPVVKGSAEDLMQERTIEVSETAEQAVVGKEARVTEQVVVGKSTEERVESIDDTVRRTKVDIEDNRQGASRPRTEGPGRDTRSRRP